ncbi:MAG: lipase chaperone [Proteobacteria bacterium]|nr:lipase chaperone [Pseudomonadota bacterium]
MRDDRRTSRIGRNRRRSTRGRRTAAASLALGALAAAILGVARWLADPVGTDAPRAATDVAAGPPRALDGPDLAAGVDGPGELPASLRGTQPDGSLALSADGHFLPTRGAVRLFDYFLSASGEEPTAVLRQRIADHLHRALPPLAALEALALLDDYLEFREALRRLASEGRVPADLGRRLQWVRELRREHFGAEVAAALFGQEEQTQLVDLERRRVALDDSLSDDERRAALAALEARLPEPVRRARERAAAPSRSHREVSALREAGGSEAEVFALRERRFGTAAAERLAALDAERALWRERLADYRKLRDAVLLNPELDPQEREAAVDALRRERFEGAERRRVQALDEATRPHP